MSLSKALRRNRGCPLGPLWERETFVCGVVSARAHDYEPSIMAADALAVLGQLFNA